MQLTGPWARARRADCGVLATARPLCIVEPGIVGAKDTGHPLAAARVSHRLCRQTSNRLRLRFQFGLGALQVRSQPCRPVCPWQRARRLRQSRGACYNFELSWSSTARLGQSSQRPGNECSARDTRAIKKFSTLRYWNERTGSKPQVPRSRRPRPKPHDPKYRPVCAGFAGRKLCVTRAQPGQSPHHGAKIPRGLPGDAAGYRPET